MKFGGVYLLHRDPRIVSFQGGPAEAAVLASPTVHHCFMHFTWLRDSSTWFLMKWLRFRVARKRLVFMCNNPSELHRVKRLRLPGILCSVNSYVNEHQFVIRPLAKRWDAVYTAQLAPFKRLPLARNIKRLYVATYVQGRPGGYDVPAFAPDLAHCDFNRDWLSAEELCEIYNSARVGLCLSAVEGAMLASAEYLLCGIPVVSTRCRGGREEFLDEVCTEWVTPETPEGVQAAVERAAAKNVTPGIIRERVLQKLHIHRMNLASLIASVVAGATGMRPRPASIYDDLFGSSKGIDTRFRKLGTPGVI